ncbi:MAG: hypothetical protein QG668_163 [Patescibacteria group bacterium]|nr:hypothetical protein [Patescibacteria group bacterium]
MNTPLSHGATPVANPLSHAWTAFKTSFDQLWKLYAVGAALMLALPLIETIVKVSAFGSFMGFVVWLIAYLIYTVHLTLTLYRSLHKESEPTIDTSLRRVPNLVGTGITAGLVILGPLLVIGAIIAIVAMSTSFAQTLPPQEPTPINTMMVQPSDEQMENYYESLMNQTGTDPSLNTLPEPITLVKDDAAMLLRLQNILLGLGGVAGLLLVIPLVLVLALYPLLRLSQASLLAVVEKNTIWENVKRSWRITKGKTWFIFSWGVLGSIVLAIASIPFSILDELMNLPLASTLFTGLLATPVSVLLGLTILERVKQNAEQQAATTPVSPVTPASPFTPNA